MIPFLQIHYNSVVQKDLVLTSNPKVYTEIVKPIKLVLFTRNLNSDEFSVLSSILALKCVGYQKPYLLNSGRFVSDGVVGCKTTLRNKKLYNFLFTLNFKVLPKMKQFEGFNFRTESNIFSFSLKDMLVFEEFVPFVKFIGELDYLHCQLHVFSKSNKDVLFFNRSIFLCIL